MHNIISSTTKEQISARLPFSLSQDEEPNTKPDMYMCHLLFLVLIQLLTLAQGEISFCLAESCLIL